MTIGVTYAVPWVRKNTPGFVMHMVDNGMGSVAIVLAIIVLPPYPFILQALGSDEFRRQFSMAAGCLAVIGGTLLYRRLPRAVVAGLLIVVSLAGAIPPLWQFFSIRSALDRVYGQPIHIGWGLWLTAVGFLVVAGAGCWILDIGDWKDHPTNRLDRGLIP